MIIDIQDLMFTFFSNAFEPAYIEVVLPPDTGEDIPDVRFQYLVINFILMMIQVA